MSKLNETIIRLEQLGWQPFFATAFEPFAAAGYLPGRVALEIRHHYVVLTLQGDYVAEVAGKLHFEKQSAAELPKVGDWVVLSPPASAESNAVIHHILPRLSKFSRQVKGRRTEEQVVATNVDTIFVVQGLDDDFNLRRLERYLTLVFAGGSQPVVVLNKADHCTDVDGAVAMTEQVAPNIAVVALSAKTGQGVSRLWEHIKPNQTHAFIGSSGVGKSTLLNVLFEETIQKTGDVRTNDSKGRHTTTQRELFILPSGGLLIDTPGMRELQLLPSEEGVAEAFADVEALAAQCHFSDCSHTHEKNCAIQAAIAQGDLTAARFESYQKVLIETAPPPLYEQRGRSRQPSRPLKQPRKKKR